jgi:hypothetical protein
VRNGGSSARVGRLGLEGLLKVLREELQPFIAARVDVATMILLPYRR